MSSRSDAPATATVAAGQEPGAAAPITIQFAKVARALQADQKLFGTAKETPQFRERYGRSSSCCSTSTVHRWLTHPSPPVVFWRRITADIAKGRALYQQANAIIAGAGNRKGNAQTDRLHHELQQVNEAFEKVAGKCEIALRGAQQARTASPTKRSGAGATAGNGSNGSGDAARKRQQYDDEDEEEGVQMQAVQFRGLVGFGEVELAILHVRAALAVTVPSYSFSSVHASACSCAC
jgi:hypothetical protein